MKHLVIVESPTKARTIQKFLGKAFRVESSFGHVRDLPKSKMGVDVEHDFAPQYVVPTKNRKRVNELKKIAAASDDVLFATDEDREGEAISWHLSELLDVPKEKAQRIVFHEITEGAIKQAISSPRPLDQHLVDAQQARRILDRLVGYELSPFLWRKITKGLSAGRVQSVAVRLIVEREREILGFNQEEYWTIELEARAQGTADTFTARLFSYNGTTLDKFAYKDEASAKAVTDILEGATYRVVDVVQKEVRKSPLPPFTTSTLQQDANRRLHFSPKKTMMLAQGLYEGSSGEGLITYMRTDSVNLSDVFLTDAQNYLSSALGARYATGARTYKTKSKLAQEAHEAIRPTSALRTPDDVAQIVDADQAKLYALIWQRALASQMPEALFDATTIDIAAQHSGKDAYVFRATGQVLKFDGFTKVYPIDSEERLLPDVKKNDDVEKVKIESLQHFTKPPARYSEAGLVKALEEHGIGRPSTYAPTISTIVERNYVTREDRRLKPTEIAFMVNDLLTEHFGSIVDFDFTARMEDNLDAIASGEKEWVPVLREFYGPFKENLTKKDQELAKTTPTAEPSDEVCPTCGKPMVIKMSRFGKFLACTGFPECKTTKSLEPLGEGEGADGEKIEIPPCEKCGSPMVMKRGRFGAFYGCSKYPECKNIRNLRDKKLDIKCPKCEQGDVVMKRSKRGKTFFGCNRYPDCDFVSWTKPGEPGEAAVGSSR